MVKVKVIHTVRLELLISQNVRPAMHKIFLALSVNLLFLPVFQLADPLGHCSHRTEGTPGTRFIENHHNQTDQ